MTQLSWEVLAAMPESEAVEHLMSVGYSRTDAEFALLLEQGAVDPKTGAVDLSQVLVEPGEESEPDKL